MTPWTSLTFPGFGQTRGRWEVQRGGVKVQRGQGQERRIPGMDGKLLPDIIEMINNQLSRHEDLWWVPSRRLLSPSLCPVSATRPTPTPLSRPSSATTSSWSRGRSDHVHLPICDLSLWPKPFSTHLNELVTFFRQNAEPGAISVWSALLSKILPTSQNILPWIEKYPHLHVTGGN